MWKVVICGSMKDKEVMHSWIQFFESQGYEVTHPFQKENELCLQEIRDRYIRKIERADLVMCISKSMRPMELVKEGEENVEGLHLSFGESTGYELAIAKYFKKRIIFV